MQRRPSGVNTGELTYSSTRKQTPGLGRAHPTYLTTDCHISKYRQQRDLECPTRTWHETISARVQPARDAAVGTGDATHGGMTPNRIVYQVVPNAGV